MTDSQLPQLVPSALTSSPAAEAPVVARKVKPKTSREEVEEILSLRVLAARVVLDDETLVSLEVVAFVFSPCRGTGLAVGSLATRS